MVLGDIERTVGFDAFNERLALGDSAEDVVAAILGDLSQNGQCRNSYPYLITPWVPRNWRSNQFDGLSLLRVAKNEHVSTEWPFFFVFAFNPN